MKRRSFVRKAALSLVSFAGALLALSYLRQFFPRLAGEKRRFTLGDPRQFPVDTYSFLDEHKLFVYRDHEGVKAVSAVCTLSLIHISEPTRLWSGSRMPSSA